MTGLCEQAIITPDCNASFLYCKQCSVTKKGKKKKYIQLTRKKKKNSVTLSISKIQVKSTVGYFTSAKMKIPTRQNKKSGEDVEKNEPLYIVGLIANLYRH